MIGIGIDFQDKRAINKFRSLPGEMSKQTTETLNAVKRMLKRDLEMNSPVGETGRLRTGWSLNITDTKDGKLLMIRNKMPYFPYVHEGTRPHLVPLVYDNVNILGLGVSMRRMVMHPGISSHPTAGNKGVQPFATRIMQLRRGVIAEAFRKGYVELVETGKAHDIQPRASYIGSTYARHNTSGYPKNYAGKRRLDRLAEVQDTLKGFGYETRKPVRLQRRGALYD
jgi:hypothetical protein